MIVKKYTGKDETEAVMKAKDDLGSNAVVLNVRTMKQRGLAKVFKKDFVEITAASVSYTHLTLPTNSLV